MYNRIDIYIKELQKRCEIVEALETGFYIFRFIFNIVCTVIVSIIFYLISDKIVNAMSIEDAFNSVLPFLNL